MCGEGGWEDLTFGVSFQLCPTLYKLILHPGETEPSKFLIDPRGGHAGLALALSRLEPPLAPDRTLELGHHVLKAHLYRFVFISLFFVGFRSGVLHNNRPFRFGFYVFVRLNCLSEELKFTLFFAWLIASIQLTFCLYLLFRVADQDPDLFHRIRIRILLLWL